VIQKSVMVTRNNGQRRLYALTLLLILLVAFNWYTVVAQSRSLQAAVIQGYQEVELDVVKNATAQIQRHVTSLFIVTMMVFSLLFLLRRAETQVKELRQEVQELRIEIDETETSEQVSAIVDTAYFQELSARAEAMRDYDDDDAPDALSSPIPPA